MAEWKKAVLSHLDSKEGKAVVEAIHKEGTLSDELLTKMKKVADTVSKQTTHLHISSEE